MNLEWRKSVRDSNLDTTAKAVAWVLDTYSDRNGLCWPGLATIAHGAGLSVTNLGTTAQAIKRLEARGFLRVSRSRRARKDAGDRTSDRASNTYLLQLPTVRQTHSPTVRQTHSDSAPNAESTVHLPSSNSASDAHEAGSKQPENQTSEAERPAAAINTAQAEAATEREPSLVDDEDLDPGAFTLRARELGLLLKDMPA